MLAEAALARDVGGGDVLGVHQAHRAAPREVRVAPGDGRADALGGVALAPGAAGEGPAYFRQASQIVRDVALEVGEPQLATKVPDARSITAQ